MHLFSMNWQQAWGPQTWELVGWTMCYFLAAGTFVALLGYVVRAALRQYAPSLRYAWSLTVFAALSAMPIAIAGWLWPEPQTESSSLTVPIELTSTPKLSPPPVIDLKDLEAIPPGATMPVLEYSQPVAQPMTTFAPAIASPPPASESTTDPSNNPLAASIIQYLPWIWLIGTPLTFILLATGLIGSRRLRHHSLEILEGPVFEACQRVRKSLAVSRKVPIAVHERIISPLLIGIVRPIILLPPAVLISWTPEEIEMVLLHELTHVRRWDNLVNLLQRLVESVLFFHPCVWWVSRWVRADREQCCDAVVVAQTAQPQAYAELLVALATPQPLAGLAMAGHPLAGRVRQILKIEEERMLVSRSTVSLVGIALAGLLVTPLWAPLDSSVAEEALQTVVEAKDLTTEVAESAEEKTSNSQDVKPPESELVIVVPEGIRDRVDYERQIKLLAEQGLATSRETGYNRYGAADEDVLVAKIPHGSVAKTVWEEDQDGPRVRVIFKNATRAIDHSRIVPQNSASQDSWTAYPPLSQIQNRQSNLNLRDLSPPTNTIEPNQIPTNGTAPPAIPVFLSLQQQRAADLAYRMLNTELGQLGVEESKRVQAMKFEGGLRVTEIKALSRTGKEPNPFQKDDLLVGLHVWPITSLEDVQQVLQRDDIEELSPLKFYVIRKTRKPQQLDGGYGGGYEGYGGGGFGGGGFGGGGFGGMGRPVEYEDKLVTGRISVYVDLLKKRLQSQRQRNAFTEKYVLATGDQVKVIATGVFPDQPLDDIYTIEPMGTLPLGPTYGRVKVVGLSLEAAEKRVQKDLAKILEDPRIQISLYETRQQREEAMRAKTYAQPQGDVNQTETTLDEWGEPVKQPKLPSAQAKREQEHAKSSAAAVKRALENELQIVVTSRKQVEKEYQSLLDNDVDVFDSPGKDVNEQLNKLKSQESVLRARIRDFSTSADLQRRKLLRQMQQADPKKQLELTEQKLQQGTLNQQDLAEIERRRSEAALQVAKQAAEAAKRRHEMGELTIDELRKAESMAVQAALEVERAELQLQEAKQQETFTVRSGSSLSPEYQLRLAEIDLRSAEATYEAANQAFTQAEQLHKKGIVSPGEFRKLQHEMKQATLQVERAQVMLSASRKQVSASSTPNASLLYDNKTFDESLANDVTLRNYEAEKLAYNRQLRALRANSPDDNSAEIKRLEKGLIALQQEAEIYKAQMKRELQQAAQQKPTLLYDNKTFNQWRSLWKNELKTEKRTEAIKALAAFGRAGYGKEAAEAILDVAGEYVFSTWGDSSAAGKLKDQVLGVLNNNVHRRLKPQWWLPDLLKRFRENPNKWGPLIRAAIPQMSGQWSDEWTRNQLLELADGEDELLRALAINGLSGISPDDPKVARLVERLLAAGDPNIAESTISLNFYLPEHLSYGRNGQPKPRQASVRSEKVVFAGLRHESLTVRQRTREHIQHVKKPVAVRIASEAAKELKFANDDPTRIRALRTLAAVGDVATDHKQLAREFIDKNKSQAVRIAAIFALMRIATGDGAFHSGFVEKMNLEDVEFGEQQHGQEHEQNFGVRYNPNGNLHGGGGFF